MYIHNDKFKFSGKESLKSDNNTTLFSTGLREKIPSTQV